MAGVASGIGGNKVRECLLDLWGFANGDLDEGSISLRVRRLRGAQARVFRNTLCSRHFLPSMRQ
jgi:hypothetical protein